MNVTVLGAGTMGHGIAHVCALAGHDVVLRDIEASIIDDALEQIEDNLQGGVDRGKISEDEAESALAAIAGETDLEASVADASLVIEAIPERLDLKQETFTTVESAAPAGVIIATNTSSLSVTEIASVLDEPGNALGLHFFNPPHIMQLVEIIEAEQTTDETLDSAQRFVEGIDRTPITVRDAPGFASSRLGIAIGVEAIRMVQEGVASPEDIDAAMRLGYNHPMGPIELGDYVGLDVRLDILEYLREELGERFRPPQLLRRKVRAGHLGRKTGKGFYVWEDGETVGVAGEVDDD